MKITETDWLECKIHNPVTREIIIDFLYFNLQAKSLVAVWFSDRIDDPDINDKTLETEWKKYHDEFARHSEGTPIFDFLLEGFLADYENPEWKAIRHNGSWLAHGPEGANVWYVVEKDVVVEEVDLSSFTDFSDLKKE
jgi:hypothetical protein